jgi:uncharacterized protein YecE (DUF72 family)
VKLVGCAGWSLPRSEQERFAEAGSHLERYASRFGAVEINSSFHRPHRPSTYARWSASVPADFRFSVKIPKTITHNQRLRDTGELVETFLSEASGLGDKLGCLLVQLPPSLSFDLSVASGFFADLRSRMTGRMVGTITCEPRHPTWFTPEADGLLQELEIARVAADPACVPDAAEPGGWRGVSYYRLHGSPRIYYSAYSEEYLAALAERIRAVTGDGRTVWCIFDNTTLGAATGNALDLALRLVLAPAAGNHLCVIQEGDESDSAQDVSDQSR